MGKTLQELLETQFNLLYYLHMSISDFDNNDAKDNEYLFSRLCKQKNEEIETRKGNNS